MDRGTIAPGNPYPTTEQWSLVLAFFNPKGNYMIKSTVAETIIDIQDTDTKLRVSIKITKGKVTLLNERNKNVFVFDTGNDKLVFKRWESVLGLMRHAVDVARLHAKTDIISI